jgi:hypothetical protein
MTAAFKRELKLWGVLVRLWLLIWRLRTARLLLWLVKTLRL